MLWMILYTGNDELPEDTKPLSKQIWSSAQRLVVSPRLDEQEYRKTYSAYHCFMT